MVANNTKARALVEARGLLQKVGFSNFSFKTIGDALGISQPALFTHFKSKEDLANQLIDDYRESRRVWAETVSVFEPLEQIGAWFEELYKYSADDFKCCPITAFIADYNSLPKSARKNINKIFEERKLWMSDLIAAGQKKKQIRSDFKSEHLAETVMGLAYGSQELARMSNDPEQVRRRKQDALSFLTKS